MALALAQRWAAEHRLALAAPSPPRMSAVLLEREAGI
jgi:hypothetical protein